MTIRQEAATLVVTFAHLQPPPRTRPRLTGPRLRPVAQASEPAVSQGSALQPYCRIIILLAFHRPPAFISGTCQPLSISRQPHTVAIQLKTCAYCGAQNEDTAAV